MKKKLLLLYAAIVIGMAFFIGCSKQAPVVGYDNSSATTSTNNPSVNSLNRLAPKHYGFIAGTLMPVPMKAAIIAYNDNNTSVEVNPATDGSFIISDLVPGVYAVKVDYVPFGSDQHSTLTIEKVVVAAGTTTNLGVINLD